MATEQEHKERFDEIRHYSMRLIARYAERDNNLDELRRMFHLEWRDQPASDWIKATMSPSAFNKVIGPVRLLTATEPQLSVPFDESDPESRQASEKLEMAAKAMWNDSGRISQRPPHYEIVFSAVLFGEICASVTKTADLLKFAEAGKHWASIARMKWISQQTPYLFNVHNPDQSYPDYDRFGLRAVLRRTKTTWSEVVDTWGALAADNYPGLHQDDEEIIINDWYDWEWRCVWLERGGITPAQATYPSALGMSDAPILCEPHELGFLPVTAIVAEGSFLFDKPELQRLPLLYAMQKSGLWKRENLGLTVIYSLVFALGSVPLLLHQTRNIGQPLVIDRTLPANMVQIAPEDKIGPFIEKILDPSLQTGLDLARRLVTESTIPDVALGAPPEHQMAFSSLSLLSQSGRLPLVAPKQASGIAIASLLTSALTWMRNDKTHSKFYRRGRVIDLAPADIPERIVLECNLEPDLPTDKLQQATIGNLLWRARLASKRWIRENIMQVGQSHQMDKEITGEMFMEAEVEALLAALAQAKAQEMQQMQQQAQQQAQPLPQQPEPRPGGGPVGIGGEGGLTPEMLAALQQASEAGQLPPEALTQLGGAAPPGGAARPGLPLQGPLPPMGQPRP